jgi:hypothetical protein
MSIMLVLKFTDGAAVMLIMLLATPGPDPATATTAMQYMCQLPIPEPTLNRLPVNLVI